MFKPDIMKSTPVFSRVHSGYKQYWKMPEIEHNCTQSCLILWYPVRNSWLLDVVFLSLCGVIVLCKFVSVSAVFVWEDWHQSRLYQDDTQQPKLIRCAANMLIILMPTIGQTGLNLPAYWCRSLSSLISASSPVAAAHSTNRLVVHRED